MNPLILLSAVAEAFYGGVAQAIAAEGRQRLPGELWAVIEAFRAKYYP